MRVRVEFTTEPFAGEDDPPDHVTHPAALLVAAGLDADVGPFGTSFVGDHRVVLPVLADVLRVALTSGASRVTMQVEKLDGAATGGRVR